MRRYHVTVRQNGSRSTWTVISRGPALAITYVARHLAESNRLSPCTLSARAA